MNNFKHSRSASKKDILADVIVLGRVSTSIKAGIPAHVLSILNTLSDSGLKFVNVVPALSYPKSFTDLFGRSRSTINKNSEEIICNSVFVYKTFALSFSFAFNICRLLLANPSAVLHIHLPDPVSILASLPCRKRKIIATFHADLLGKGVFSILYRVLLKLLASKNNVVFVVPTPAHIQGSSLNTFNVKPIVLPFIFSDSASNPDTQSIISESYDSSVTRFLFVGRHVPYKGIDIAIRAFMSLPKNLPAQFNIVGSGPLTHDLKKLANSDSRIHFLGSISDSELSHYYSLSNVFVLSSTTKAEAFGLVQVEAMLHHCMCISSYLGNGVNFVNKEGVSGFSFKVNDHKSLADLMIKACSDKCERNKLMSSAREYALSSFASNNLRHAYFQLYSN